MIWRDDSRQATKGFTAVHISSDQCWCSTHSIFLISSSLSGLYKINTLGSVYVYHNSLSVVCKKWGYFAVNEACQDVCWPLFCSVRALSLPTVLCNEASLMDISVSADSPLRSGANQCRFFCTLTLIARRGCCSLPPVCDRPSSWTMMKCRGGRRSVLD